MDTRRPPSLAKDPGASFGGAGALHALAAAALAAVAAIYQLFFTPDFLNDHFMHVAWARQMLAGEWPVRDFFEPGMPLTVIVSAAAERAIGYRLLSEGLIVSLGVGIAVLLTSWTTSRLSGRTISGVLAGLLVTFTFARSYSYPKVLLYAIAIWLAVGYARTPGRLRLLALGVLTAAAFWFRHDHGLLIGAAVVVLLQAVHRTEWRPAAIFAATAIGLSLPYVVYAMVQPGGALAYWQSSLAFVIGESAKASPLIVPPWPLRTLEDWILLRGVAGAPGAAAALFYLFAMLPLALMACTVAMRRLEWPIVIFLAVLSYLTFVAFLRDPLSARIGDAAVGPAVIFGLIVAQLMSLGGKSRRAAGFGVVAFRTVGFVAIVVVMWMAANVGIVARRIEIMSGRWNVQKASEEWRDRWRQVQISPPLAGVAPSSDRAAIVIARYLSACTPPESRVFVAGFAPDIYYFADRRFTGRIAFMLSGFWQAPSEQEAIRQALDHRPPAALITVGSDLIPTPQGFEEIFRWIDERYVQVAEVHDEGRLFRLLAPKNAVPVGTYGGQQWPCYAS